VYSSEKREIGSGPVESARFGGIENLEGARYDQTDGGQEAWARLLNAWPYFQPDVVPGD